MGAVPRLEAAMTDATTGKPVTADDFRGKVVMLYFGYAQCPDVCPLTLQNLADVLGRLGKCREPTCACSSPPSTPTATRCRS